MSGIRPKDPDWSVVAWDSDSFTTGANPWNGQPKRVYPGSAFFTPDAVAPAEHINGVVGRLGDADSSAGLELAAILDMAGQATVISWERRSTGRIAATYGGYNHVEGAWYIVNGNSANEVERSYDGGHVWSTPTFSGSTPYVDLDTDNSGNMVFIPVSNNIQNGTYSSGSVAFTNVSAPFTGTPSGGQIVFDEVNGKWIAAFRNASSGIRVYTSTNRTSWTDRTAGLPATYTSYTGSNNPKLYVNSLGHAVLLLETASGNIEAGYSDDGGVTWNTNSIASGAGYGSPTRPVYLAQHETWVLALHNGSLVKIATSDDGITWSLIGLTMPIGGELPSDLVEQGAIVGMLTSLGRVYYSVDGGVFWRFAEITPSFGAASCHMVGDSKSGRNLIADATNTTVVLSARIGKPGTNF